MDEEHMRSPCLFSLHETEEKPRGGLQLPHEGSRGAGAELCSLGAGATRMNTDLSNGDSGIWILADPEGFEEAYGALSEALGSDWAGQLIPWTDVPSLAGADLGSYDTSADGSTSQSVQELFADYQIAVLDSSDGLWDLLTHPAS